jgi:hypothetical protein
VIFRARGAKRKIDSTFERVNRATQRSARERAGDRRGWERVSQRFVLLKVVVVVSEHIAFRTLRF